MWKKAKPSINVRSNQFLKAGPFRLTQDTSPPLPDVPRPITGHIRWRVWIEPRVRIWALFGLALLATVIWFVIDGMYAHAHDKWLIRDGLKLDAVITVANTETIRNRPQPADSIVKIEFPWEAKRYNPHERTLEGRKQGDPIITGSILPIHVNPNNPEDWTWLDEPMPILTRMIGALVAAPLLLFTIALAVRAGIGVRITWQRGAPLIAQIVSLHSPAVAPRCRVARVTPLDENDNQIFTVNIPPSENGLQAGDEVEILVHGKRAAAITWFD
jgi:hypothetical protein